MRFPTMWCVTSKGSDQPVNLMSRLNFVAIYAERPMYPFKQRTFLEAWILVVKSHSDPPLHCLLWLPVFWEILCLMQYLKYCITKHG